MNRRTKKRNDGWYDINLVIDENVDKELKPLVTGEYLRHSLNKLGHYEDIDEELGIDYPILIKALKQETLFIKTDFDIRETVKNGEGWGMKHLSFEDGEFVIFAQILYPNNITHKEWLTPLRLKLCDYGKTWALTKGELL